MDKELDKMKESLLADIESYNKIYNDAETYEKFKKEIDTVQSNGYYCDVIFSGVFVILGIYRFITGFIDSNGLDIVGSMVLLWFVHRNMKNAQRKLMKNMRI